MRERADVENVVVSACRSFFQRNQRGEFAFGGWEDLWSLLAIVTLRKCTKRRKYLRAARRDIGREVAWAEAGAELSRLADRAPTPADASVATEALEQVFNAVAPSDRPIVELIMMGCPSREIAEQVDASVRTVERVRQRVRQQIELFL